MANTRALVKRRKAVRNIKKITRTMELIATARFKKALDRASEAEAYTRKIAELAADLSASASNVTHPLLQKREEVRNTRAAGDRAPIAACAAATTPASSARPISASARSAAEDITLHLELSGKRPINFFRYQGIKAEHTYTHFEDKPSFDEVEELANRYIDGLHRRQDRPRRSGVHEVPQRGPADAGRRDAAAAVAMSPAGERSQAAGQRPVEYEFLPSAADILEEILPVSFKVRLFKCFLDAAVSEQIARRVTMKQATENADDMIKRLTRQYNRARQAQITKEIAEVIGGAAALE